MPSPTSGSLPSQALDALRHGNKIEAIKIVRQATGLGLAEAKALVDAYEAGRPPVGMALRPTSAHAGSGLSPGQVGHSSAGKWWVVLLIVGAAVAFFLLR
jgi:Ribosomal protein L7/L12 C-terminal domain